MTDSKSTRWEQIQKIFNITIQKNTKDRETTLKELCQSDYELYEEVKSLLKADEDSSSILEGGALDAVKTNFLNDYKKSFSFVGKQAGKYHLLKLIASGGMGDVYLAERTDGQFDHKVAVKIIKPGMNSEQIIRRFQNERQILANLDHPNIARLIDGGLIEDQYPYFTMEYVEGTPIDEYSSQNHLSLNERLKLFQTVCAAVQYAHKNLVIHRDLKPGNILVTQDGVVKLLDFGIARVFEENIESVKMTALTRAGLKIMTPEYASPEQVQGNNVTTSSDIYSLGVLLYQLITNQHPFDLSKKTPSQIEKIIVEETPPKPSTVIKKIISKSQNEEAINWLELNRMKRELNHDLDTICLMALRKEPERRYSSPEQLSEDIQQYLKGKPIIALRDSLLYRSKKFIKRNKSIVFAATISFIIINFLIGFYTIRLTQERDRVQLEANKAFQVSDFLTQIFEISNPRESRGETITARELLDNGADQIEQDSTMNLELKAQLLYVIGKVYHSLGMYENSQNYLNKALDIRKTIFDDHHPDIAITLWSLGVLSESQGKYREAAETQQIAAQLLREHAEKKPRDLANVLHSLAHAEMRLYHVDEAEKYIREALVLKRQEYGDGSKEVAYSLNILGDIYSYANRGDEAEKIHRQVLSMRRELFGSNHLDVAVTLHNLAAALRDQDRNSEAEPYYREALQIFRKVLGEENQEVANVLNQLGVVVRRQGRYKEAIELQSRSIKMLEKLFNNSDHPRLVNSLAHYGRALYDAGKYKEAEMNYRKAIAMHRRIYYGERKSPSEMWWLAGLGRVVSKQGRFQEAEQLLLQSQKICHQFEGARKKECADMLKAYLSDLYASWKTIK